MICPPDLPTVRFREILGGGGGALRLVIDIPSGNCRKSASFSKKPRLVIYVFSNKKHVAHKPQFGGGASGCRLMIYISVVCFGLVVCVCVCFSFFCCLFWSCCVVFFCFCFVCYFSLYLFSLVFGWWFWFGFWKV